MDNGCLLEISENIRPMLENQATRNIPGKGRVKTGDYKRFKTNLLEALANYEKEKQDFLSFIEGSHFQLEATLFTYVPKEFMYKKDGDISVRKGDCQATRKCTQDVIFDWLGIDDKYILDSHDHQREDDQGLWGFSFTIKAKKR